MKVILERYKGHANDVTKVRETLQELDGRLVEGCSIMEPIILLNIPAQTIIRTCNYASIPAFARFYFLKQPPTVRSTNMWEFHFHVDVLSSFQDRLREQAGIVKRQEQQWNLNLDDGQCKAYQNNMYSTLVFPRGFTGQSFILTTAGGTA